MGVSLGSEVRVGRGVRVQRSALAGGGGSEGMGSGFRGRVGGVGVRGCGFRGQSWWGGGQRAWVQGSEVRGDGFRGQSWRGGSEGMGSEVRVGGGVRGCGFRAQRSELARGSEVRVGRGGGSEGVGSEVRVGRGGVRGCGFRVQRSELVRGSEAQMRTVESRSRRKAGYRG